MAKFECATFVAGWDQVAGSDKGDFRMTATFPDRHITTFMGQGRPLMLGLNALGQQGWEYSGEYHYSGGSGLYSIYGVLKRSVS